MLIEQSAIYAILIFHYLFFAGLLYFYYSEKLKIIELISLSRNPRKRPNFLELTDQVSGDRKLTLLWPLLILIKLGRGINVNRQKK